MWLLILSMAVYANSAFGSSNLDVTSESQELRLSLKANVTLPCQVTGEFNPYLNQIVWTKRSSLTPAEEDGTQINMQTLLKPPFKNTGRHSTVLTEIGGVAIDLIISDLRLEDDGVYTCQVLDSSGPVAGVSHSITVPVPVDTLQLVSNTTREEVNSTKIVYQFEEMKDSYLSCRSTGGNPKPTLHLTRAGSDVTSELEKIEEYSEPIGEIGLQKVEHRVQLVTSKFRASFDDNGKELKCVAKIPGSPELRTTVMGHVDVIYSPVVNCTGPHYITPIITSMDLVCWVRAHPTLKKESIQWRMGSVPVSNITMAGAGNSSTSRYNISIEDTGDEQWTIVRLSISDLNTTDYNTYTLHVANSVGTRSHDVTISEATTTISTSSTTATTTTTSPVVNDQHPNKPGELIPGQASQICLQTSLLVLSTFIFICLV